MALRSVLAVVLFVAATTAVRGEELYQSQPGPQAVQVVEEFTFKTPQRDVPLRISFPENGGPYPVLLWLHGALGSKDAYQPLVMHWVTHGYVVIQPTFGDSRVYLTDDDRKRMGNVKGAVNSDHVMSQWDDRPREVKLLIDALRDLEREVPGLAGKMNIEQLAVGGHSYGAHTSMLLGGVQARVGLVRTQSFADERIKAFLLVSPSGITPLLPARSFTHFAGPALVVTGDNDGSPVRGQEGKAGPWRREVFDHGKPDDLYLLWIKDAHHNFGGISGAHWAGAGPDDPQQVRIVTTTCLALLDAYLKGSEPARAYLQGEAVRQATGGQAWTQTR